MSEVPLQERDASYYETASISFVVGDREPLYKLLRAAGGIDDGAEGPALSSSETT